MQQLLSTQQDQPEEKPTSPELSSKESGQMRPPGLCGEGQAGAGLWPLQPSPCSSRFH